MSLLVLHGNQPLNADRLIDAMWGSAPPRSASGALRTYVWGLRSLPGMRDRIALDAAGYRLQLEPGEADVQHFRWLSEAGRQALENGRTEYAASLLREALDLWRDPPLADVPRTSSTEAVLAEMSDRHRVVHATWIDVRLMLGHHGDLVPHLRDAVYADPYDERAWVQLLTSLHRCGRRAEALSTYKTVRGLLARELGIEPGEALQRLHHEILA